MKEHDLKTWPQFFDPIQSGIKNFELRSNDRGFEIGDVLLLREWHPVDMEYTGREIRKMVTYMTVAGHADVPGLEPGYAILGLDG